jgi:hypothetical protein
MRAHTHLSHKYTYTDIYIYTYDTHTYRHTYIPLLLRAAISAISAHVHTHACARPHAHIGGPAAHNGLRRIDVPAERVPPAVARRPGRKAAHTWDNVMTAAVFHAPMFALNADAWVNACAPRPPAVHAGGRRSHVSARMRGTPIAHAHTRARTDAARARACAAGPHRRSVHRGS